MMSVLIVPHSYEGVGWLWSPADAATLIKVSVSSHHCAEATCQMILMSPIVPALHEFFGSHTQLVKPNASAALKDTETGSC